MRVAASLPLVLGVLILSVLPADAQVRESARLNRVVELLDEGHSLFGTITGDLSLTDARAVVRSGLDFIIVDMEHTPWNAETLRIFLLGMTDREAIAASASLQMAVTPFVRIPANGRENLQLFAKQALDVGVYGVMFPFVSTREETENAIESMRYPRPIGSGVNNTRGIRGWSPGNATWYWGISATEYFEKADVWPLSPNGELLAIIQIETREGVANIDEIITVPGVGVLFVGPSDLAIQMGFGDQRNHPAVEEAIQLVLQSCIRNDVPCAITTDAGSVAERIQQGFRFVTVGGVAGLPASTVDALRIGRETAGRL